MKKIFLAAVALSMAICLPAFAQGFNGLDMNLGNLSLQSRIEAHACALLN